jgi:hypothetical protein
LYSVQNILLQESFSINEDLYPKLAKDHIDPIQF